MAFALSGSTITQTGTDTSLAGLSAIAGVTTIALGDGFLYSFPTLTLNISGILTIADPSKQTYIAFAVRVLNGGNYTSGTFCTDGITPKTGGVHFNSVGVSSQFVRGANAASFEVQSGGQYKFIGGIYYVSGGIAYLSGATNIEEFEVSVIASRAFGMSSIRIFYGTPNVSKTNCKHYDVGIDLFQKPTSTRPFSVKAFNSEYVSQYVGSNNGGTDLLFIASGLSNQDGTFDFDNYDAGYVELYNCASGANLKVTCQANRTYHCVPLFQNVNIKITNLSNVVQNGVNFKFIDASVSNTPTAIITTNGGVKSWDFRNPITYTGTTNTSGLSAVTPVLQVWHGATNLKNLRFPLSTINPQFRAYALETQVSSLILGSDTAQSLSVAMTAIPLSITQAQAQALTGISFSPSGTSAGTITVTSNKTVTELWACYRNWISQIANFGSNDTWTFENAILNTGNWNIINSAIITGNITTAGTVTGTGTVNGVYTDATGTSSQINLNGLTAGSSVLLTDGSNNVVEYVASSTTSYTRNIQAGQTGTWKWKVAKYGCQLATGTFTPLTGGINTVNVAYTTDAFVVDTQANVIAYTDLNTAQKIYDALANFGTTQVGMLLGSLATRGFGTLTVNGGLVLNASTTVNISVTSGILTTKTIALSEDVTLISTSNITATATLSNDVKIRALNFDSEIIAQNVTNVILYPTATDQSSGTNAGPTFTSIFRFKSGTSVLGVLMSGNQFARVAVGSVVLQNTFTLNSGRNIVDLGTTGQLQVLITQTQPKSIRDAMTLTSTAGNKSIDDKITDASLLIPTN